MAEDIIDMVETDGVKLSGNKWAVMDAGVMYILERVVLFGKGFRVVTHFTFDDFQELVNLSEEEKQRLVNK